MGFYGEKLTLKNLKIMEIVKLLKGFKPDQLNFQLIGFEPLNFS